MATADEPVFVDSALLDRAEAVCRARVEKASDSPAALRSLAAILRKQGKLEEAAVIFARLAELDPEDRTVRYQHAVFSGSAWPPAPDDMIAAPFVFLKNVVPQEIHQRLLPLVVSARDSLVPATVGTGVYKPDARESLELPKPLEWDVMKWMHRRLGRLVTGLGPRLNVPEFDIGSVEFKVRVYTNGNFFRTHMDVSPLIAGTSHRKISYVYFFHKVPRPYSGGDLLLFDTDITKNQYRTDSFTRIRPEDNALIAFPSRYYHCVVPLQCPGDDLTDSRFVINGHVIERAAPSLPVSSSRTVEPS